MSRCRPGPLAFLAPSLARQLEAQLDALGPSELAAQLAPLVRDTVRPTHHAALARMLVLLAADVNPKGGAPRE